jgi:hypothetical protein
MRRHFFFVVALLMCAFLLSCGNSNSSPTSVKSNVGAPMSLSIGDTPPNGVAILFFEASITGASLQPSDSSKPAVSVLTSPVEVEFGHLQTDTAFVSLANVMPGMYQSMTLTFGNATMTIVNHSPTAFPSCAMNSVCMLTPSFSPTMVTVTGSHFPLTITQNSAVGIRLDFNVDASVQNDLSIHPTVTIKQLIQREDADEDKEMEDLDEVDGTVTAVGSNQFTLTKKSGQSFTIAVNSSTVFEDFDRSGCTASPANFSCVKMGQVLDVDLSGSGTGTMLAKRVEFEENAAKQALKGTITSVDSATQFHMVVFNEEPTMNGIAEGSSIAVTIQSGAVFQVGREEMGEDGGFSISGLSFASSTDLMTGQDVQIRPGTVTTSGGVTTVTTDLVRLWPSQVSGKVGSVNADGSFTLIGLSPLFTGATPSVTTIKVVTLSDMDFLDFAGLSSQSVGSKVSVKGLLFNTSGTPTLVTRTMREHDGD